MSEPRHIYERVAADGKITHALYDKDWHQIPKRRYSLTEGEEWNALMERARATLPSGGAHTFADVMKLLMDRGDILRDILAYVGEQQDGR